VVGGDLKMPTYLDAKVPIFSIAISAASISARIYNELVPSNGERER